MKYISRAYLSEKWRNLKWDMERTLDIFGQSHDDSISEEEFRAVEVNIRESMKAIWKEFGFDC